MRQVNLKNIDLNLLVLLDALLEERQVTRAAELTNYESACYESGFGAN